MAYCDLNVPCKDNINELVSALCKSGYQKVALTHTVSQINKTAAFKATVEEAKKHFGNDNITAGGKIKTTNQPQVYTRLNLTLSGQKDDSGQVLSSNNPVLAMYDILSVAPDDFKSFQAACALDVDIIVVPPHSYFSYIKHAIVKSAMARGVHFELCLGPYLRNMELRKNFFAGGAALVNSTGGKNILLTNGAETPEEIRGAYDIANLATLLGIDFGIAKSALTHAPNSIIKRAEARKSAKAVLRVSDIPSNDSTPSSTSASDPSSASNKTKSTTTPAKKAPLPDFIPFGDEPPPKSGDQAQQSQQKRKGKRKADNK